MNPGFLVFLITLVLAGCAAPRERQMDWGALADYLEKQNER